MTDVSAPQEPEVTIVAVQGRWVSATSSEHMLTLYRAVQPDELADIQRAGQFVNRGSAEGKYFSLTGEGTSAYAKQAVQAFGDLVYTLVTTQIPEDMITPAMRATVDRGVPAIIVPDHLLPSLIPKIENLMFIP